jgi:hypothetical protein
MPVIGPPVPPIPDSSVNCADQSTVQTTVTTVEGVPSYARKQGFQVVQGQLATIQTVMRSINGDPVDLTSCVTAGATVVVSIVETTIIDLCTTPPIIINGTVIDATNGIIQFILTQPAVTNVGIYDVEAGLFDDDSNLIFSSQLYMIVNRGQFGPLPVSSVGPPTIAEIRLHMRDSDPADNLWLRVVEWDTAELAAAIQRPILYFNETPPPIRHKFTTSTFPFRYNYLEAIVGCLYQTATIWYTRVHLPYEQAQGLKVDDKNKAEQYAAIGKQRWDDWKEWARFKKVQLNAGASFKRIGSQYYGQFWRES